MPRTPHAAKVLIGQVRTSLNRKADSKVGIETGVPAGDPDGLGVYRSVIFDKTASKRLLAAREAVESDERVESFEVDKGQVTVTFVGSSPLADSRDPFDLTATAEVEDDPS